MNYRGAKVNVTGEVTQAEIHAAWLQLVNLKSRGQKYLRGKNFRIISSSYGDIINITGKHLVRKKEEKKKEPVIITSSVTAICFVYDDVVLGNYTGNGTVCGITSPEIRPIYNVAGLAEAPLDPSFMITGGSLTDIGDAQTYEGFDLTESPEEYSLSDGSTSYNTSKVYPMDEFFSLVLDSTYNLAHSSWDPFPNYDKHIPADGGPYTLIYYDGALCHNISADEILIFCSAAEAVIPPYVYSPFTPASSVKWKEYCDGIYAYIEGEGLTGDVDYEVDASYPDKAISLSDCIYFSIRDQPSGWFVSDSGDPENTKVNEAYTGKQGIIAYAYEPLSDPLPVVVLPNIKTAGNYNDTVTYTSLTTLETESLYIYGYGIPRGFDDCIQSDHNSTLVIQINDEVVHEEEISGNSVQIKQASIYELDDGQDDLIYVYIIYLVVGGSDLHFVFRKSRAGTISNLSSGFDNRYTYLRVALVTYLIEEEI